MKEKKVLFLKVVLMALILVAFTVSINGTAYAQQWGGWGGWGDWPSHHGGGHGHHGGHGGHESGGGGTAQVPEPASFALMGAGLIGSGIYLSTRRKNKK